MNKDKNAIIFVPRSGDFLKAEVNRDLKLGALGTLLSSWKARLEKGGKGTLDLVLEEKEVTAFPIVSGADIYVFSGHGMVGSSESTWNGGNALTAQKVAEMTAARIPEGAENLGIKIYHCHSAEGGATSFAAAFAQAFKPTVRNCSGEILGYSGLVTPRPQALTAGNVGDSLRNAITAKRPEPKLKMGDFHRWSKAAAYNNYQSRASEARECVASFWLKDGTWSLSVSKGFEAT